MTLNWLTIKQFQRKKWSAMIEWHFIQPRMYAVCHDDANNMHIITCICDSVAFSFYFSAWVPIKVSMKFMNIYIKHYWFTADKLFIWISDKQKEMNQYCVKEKLLVVSQFLYMYLKIKLSRVTHSDDLLASIDQELDLCLNRSSI